MTTTASTSKSAIAPSIARMVLAVAWLAIGGARRLIRAFQHRRDARMLLGADDRMLADIGLTRSDLHDAYAQPLWQDPTDVLASRATERRASRGQNRFNASTNGAARAAALHVLPMN